MNNMFKNNFNKENIELYKSSDNPEVYFLLEKPVSDAVLYRIKRILTENLGIEYNVNILSVLDSIPKEKDIKNNTSIYYTKNSIDLKEYIKPISKIVCCGRSLFSLIKSSDFMANSFYDTQTNNSYFYHPELKSIVFPIDATYNWIGENNDFKYYFAIQQIKKAYEYNYIPYRLPNLNLVEIKDIDTFYEDNFSKKEISIDIETDGFHHIRNNIGYVTMSFDGITGYFVEWNKIDPIKFGNFIKNKLQIGANYKFDCKFLIAKGVPRECLHIYFDTYNAGHLLNEMRNNSLKSHAWYYTNYGGYDFELDEFIRNNPYINKNFLKIPKEIIFKYATMDAIITFQVYKAMKKQFEVIDKKYPLDNGWSLSKQFYDITIPTLNLFIDIETEGLYIDWNKAEEVGKQLLQEIENTEKEILLSFEEKYKTYPKDSEEIKTIKSIVNINTDSNSLFGESTKEFNLNINSGKDLGLFLEYIMKYPDHGKTKTKVSYYKVNDETLDKWEKAGYKEAKLIKKQHKLSTLYDNFIGNKEDKSGIWKHKVENKVYPNYSIHLADSLRNRCGEPNLQNVVKRGLFAKEIRSIYTVPSNDYLIGEVDYSGLQLRIGAILSGDRVMVNIFINLSGDMHSLTANNILKRDISFEEFLKNKHEGECKLARYNAKAINFGLLFGSTAQSFAKQSLLKDWSLEDCKEYIKKNNLQNSLRYLRGLKSYNKDINFVYYWCVAINLRKEFFNTYRGLEKWHKEVQKFAHDNGFVRSVFGAFRRLPELAYYETLDYYKDNKLEKPKHLKNLSNISLNSPVQAFEISIISLAMVNTFKRIKEENLKSKIVGMVHDSCVFYIHKEEKDIMKKIIVEEFEKKLSVYKDIPILIEGELSDVEKGEVWGSGKEWI